MPPLTDKQKAKILRLRRTGKTYKEIKKATGNAQSTICRVLSEAGLTKPQEKSQKASTKAGRKTGRSAKDETAYLLWALKGTLNGWVDRLIKDISSGRFEG